MTCHLQRREGESGSGKDWELPGLPGAVLQTHVRPPELALARNQTRLYFSEHCISRFWRGYPEEAGVEDPKEESRHPENHPPSLKEGHAGSQLGVFEIRESVLT